MLSRDRSTKVEAGQLYCGEAQGSILLEPSCICRRERYTQGLRKEQKNGIITTAGLEYRPYQENSAMTADGVTKLLAGRAR